MNQPWRQLPAPAMRAWLQAPGSLTRHLARAQGAVRVQVLQQGAAPLWAHEAAALQRTPAHQGSTPHVRTVLMWCGAPPAQAVPAVLARSVVLGPQSRLGWRGIRNLGERPLAQLLFDTPHIQRSPLRWHYDAPGSPIARHVLSLWQAQAPAWAGQLPQRGVWRRSSVFSQRGARLLVTEWFAPLVWHWPLQTQKTPP